MFHSWHKNELLMSSGFRSAGSPGGFKASTAEIVAEVVPWVWTSVSMEGCLIVAV